MHFIIWLSYGYTMVILRFDINRILTEHYFDF